MDIGGYTRLRRRLTYTMLAFSLVPLFALGFFIHLQFSKTYHERIVSGIEAVTESKRRALDTFLAERVAQIKSLAWTHSFHELSNSAQLSTIFGIIQSNARSYVDLGVINDQGQHVAYVGPYSLEAANYRDEPWFQEVMLKGQYVSDVFTGFRHVPHFIIAVMRRENGRAWILRATIDSAAISAMLHRAYSGTNSDAFLLGTDGGLQSDSRNNGAIMTKPGLRMTIPDRAKRGVVVATVANTEGRPMVTGMTWLENMPWLLVVMDDPREPLSPLAHAQFIVVLLLLGGAVVICLGTFFTTRVIVNKVIEADRRQAMLDASLMQSSKMAALGKLAAGVAHEINNPLMLIRENAGWIRDLLSEEDSSRMAHHGEIEEAANKIEQHVDRAKGITHRMLGFGRRMEPMQQDVPLNVLTEQTVKFLESEALHRNIAIRKDFDPELPAITTDTAQVQQVILNVLDNAIDAVGRDGSIAVRTGAAPDGSEVFVAVSDTGGGIPSEVLEHIFDPFYTTKKAGEGTGLGLAICYSIMEKLGGRIVAESTPGNGAIFTVYLPTAPPAFTQDTLFSVR